MSAHVFGNVEFHGASRWIPPASPLLEERLDAPVFVRGLVERGDWLTLRNLKVRIREGERLTAAEAHRLGVYRPSCIRQLVLDDSALGSMPSSWGAMPTVGTSDVVVSKFLPAVAAWVTPTTPRRPVDGNCVRVTGLEGTAGFWVANVLSHPTYQAVLTSLVGGAALPRLGVRDLRSLPVPTPPAELTALVPDWSNASWRRSAAQLKLRRLRDEVNTWVAADAPSPPDAREPHFHASAALSDSWVPMHAALKRFQDAAAARGWKALGELIRRESERLRGRPLATLRVLRLGDTNGVFGFDLPELAELQHPSFRIYGDPIESDEVLLSALGSAPKVVFNHRAKDATVYLTDHWVRLRGSAAPGALALVIDSPAVTSQLALAATGAARQFVSRSELAAIRVPWPAPSEALRWHDRLVDALEIIAEADAKLDAIRTEVAVLVDACVGSAR